MRVPTSTYRLQVRPEFDLHAVAGITQYLHDLGVDWLYLSPLLRAASGSSHGYDVIDHGEVDPERGGSTGLHTVSANARRLGMGVLVDIVPNHVGVGAPLAHPWWYDVLTHGRDSRAAEAFDIDWDVSGGKVRVPILGDEDAPELAFVDGQLRYHEHRFPVAAGTAADGADAATVLGRQHYELINWRRADTDLNYRRFFAVNTLAAVRVEVPWVFADSHREIVRWVRAGLVDGLRVDHPDGLADPGGYLTALSDATGGVYVVVEKILHGDEELPPDWARDGTSGTTGYEALATIDRVLVDPAGEAGLDAADGREPGRVAADWAELIHGTKRSVADGILRSEVLRIARALDGGPATGPPGADTADAVAEALTCFPVYRSYLPFGREHLDEALVEAARRRPDLAPTIDAIAPALADPAHPAAVRFQQTSGMVMAKGVEDQAFYRFNRLGTLTEVGADPSELAVSVEEFHRRQRRRLAASPAALTALTTHDTKRSEDVRARLSTLSELTDEWAAGLAQLRRLAPLGDPPFEELFWQAVLGAWPISPDRLAAYAEKAAREAGTSTTWQEPSATFEAAVGDVIERVFHDERVGAVLAPLLDAVVAPGWSNALAAKLLQLTVPGVPDVYQGSELWALSLVDPDNRQPVDFDVRQELLRRIDGGWLPPVDETGAAKLLVTARALRLRRDRPDLFAGYEPGEVTGEAADHAVAFDRGGAVTVVTRRPVGLTRRGGWGDTAIALGAARVSDVIGGESFDGPVVRAGDVLARYPVALLVKERS